MNKLRAIPPGEILKDEIDFLVQVKPVYNYCISFLFFSV
jgi:hypothetical protein